MREDTNSYKFISVIWLLCLAIGLSLTAYSIDQKADLAADAIRQESAVPAHSMAAYRRADRYRSEHLYFEPLDDFEAPPGWLFWVPALSFAPPLLLGLLWRRDLVLSTHVFVLRIFQFIGWPIACSTLLYGWYILHYGLYTHPVLRSASVCVGSVLFGGSSTFYGFDAFDCQTKEQIAFLGDTCEVVPWGMYIPPPPGRIEYSIDKMKALHVRIFGPGKATPYHDWRFDAKTRAFAETSDNRCRI